MGGEKGHLPAGHHASAQACLPLAGPSSQHPSRHHVIELHITRRLPRMCRATWQVHLVLVWHGDSVFAVFLLEIGRQKLLPSHELQEAI